MEKNAKYELNKGIIVKTDFENYYEPSEFVATLTNVEKKLVEMEAQKKVYDAKADNVARNHPHVLKVDEEKRNAIWIYHENFVAGIQAAKIIKQLKKDIKGLKAEMAEITNQTGHKFE